MALQPARPYLRSHSVLYRFPAHHIGLLLMLMLAVFSSGASGESRRWHIPIGKRVVAPATTVSSSAFFITADLPSGTVGNPYSGRLAAVGGTAPYNLSVSAGALPPGLGLNSSTGEISGTPTTVVTKTFWVKASDSLGASARLHVQITIGASPQPQVAIGLILSPTSATLQPGGTQQFSATVQGTSNTAVNWSATAGTISSNGVFTAPLVSSNITVTVTATSAMDASVQSSSIVTVNAPTPVVSLAVSPTSASVTSSGTQQFTATVQGTSNTGVTWAASAGKISSNGVFTAPVVSSNITVTVAATSAADATVRSSASVTVNAPAPVVSVGVSPSSASVASSGTQKFTATVQGTSNPGVTWTASAGTISSAGTFTAPAVSSDMVVNVTATSVADASASSSASVKVTAQASTPPPPTPPPSTSGILCGTDSNGVPTDNSQCGAQGTNAYTSESATDLAGWCGGSLPGNCTAITSCNQTLTAGTYSQHNKYYLSDNLSCGAASLALKLARYTETNLNGFTITGVVYSNMGVKGWHLFNGTVNCSVQSPSLIASGLYAYGCLQDSNNGGIYTPGGGDQIRIHHISGQNSFGCAKFIQLDGGIATPAGGWSEPAVVVYNNTFQSVPVTTSCPREYAGVYSQTQPVEYYNNRGDVGATGPANATQLLVVYSPGTNGSYPNYIHNNYLSCETFNVNNTEVSGDTCRPILCDGALSCHVQYNDIWPTNNRALRLRDAFNAEVDHNYIHSLSQANGYTGVAVHTGDNDVNSAHGQSLDQNVHDNTFELGANALGILLRDQQGVTLANNNYLCAQSGCSNARIANVANLPLTGGLAINQVTKVLSCSTCDFYYGGREYKTGSSVTLSGWSNAGNNGTFVVAVGPNATNTTQMVLSDPNNVLVSETGTSSSGAYPTSTLSIQSASFGTNLLPEATVMPQATLQECSSMGISVSGGGNLLTSCN